VSRTVTIGIDGRSLAGSPTGVGRYVANLVAAMSSMNPEVRLRLLLAAAPQAGARPGLAGVETRVLRTPLVDNVFTWNHLRLPVHLMTRPVDLFHGTFYTLPAFCPAPAVVTIHDITFHLHPEWYTRKARIAFNGFAASSARKARHILTVSECSRRDIIKAYGVPASKVTAVPLAPDPSFGPAQEPAHLAEVRKRYRLGEEYLLHVGSITPRRNLGRLLEAFASVRRRAPHLTLVLAGSVEPPSPPIEAAIGRSGLSGSVRVAGYVRAEDLPALYGGAAAVVCPSLYEGFGLPVLEAMASGIPVLASSTSCFPEVAGDAALLVDPTSTEAIAEGLWSVLSDVALRGRLREKGLARAAEFTWERAARGTLAVYQRALSDEAPRRAGETA
jgi:glycosyltransferase involved in cell wall biosynthesis